MLTQVRNRVQVVVDKGCLTLPTAGKMVKDCHIELEGYDGLFSYHCDGITVTGKNTNVLQVFSHITPCRHNTFVFLRNVPDGTVVPITICYLEPDRTERLALGGGTPPKK